MDVYKHKETIFLVSLMLVFTLVFFLSYQFFRTGQAIISIGMGSDAIDIVVMLLSVISIIRIIFLIKGLEVRAAGGM